MTVLGISVVCEDTIVVNLIEPNFGLANIDIKAIGILMERKIQVRFE